MIESEFPCSETREKLKAALNKGKIEKLCPAFRDFIVNNIEPFERGNGDALWTLHRLDIVDKHGSIILTVSRFSLPSIRINATTADKFEGFDITLNQRAKDGPILDAAKRKIERDAKATLDVRFAKGQILEGKSVIPSLLQFSKFVEGTIR